MEKINIEKLENFCKKMNKKKSFWDKTGPWLTGR